MIDCSKVPIKAPITKYNLSSNKITAQESNKENGQSWSLTILVEIQTFIPWDSSCEKAPKHVVSSHEFTLSLQ